MCLTSILLVGAENAVKTTVREVVGSIKNCVLEVVDGADSALARLQDGNVGLVLACRHDRTTEGDVVRLLRAIGKLGQSIPAIVLSQQTNSELSQRMFRLGAVDCMARPIDVSRLALLVDVLTVRARFQQRISVSQPEGGPATKHQDPGDFVLGTSAIGGLMERLRLVAPLDSTVLVTGETGTGKTHMARLIHQLSPRQAKPFVVVPCGSLSPMLVESEMFGHVRGAFTHAERDRVGKFAHAADGTLLLDEIDCVPPEAQAKLLRTFEERVFEPVGSNEPQSLRARLIVASNRPLEQEVSEGRFRSDLYYRLNVIEFHIPPLRERPEMVRPLAEKFLAKLSRWEGEPPPSFSDAAMTALEAYGWPGNVRELRNVVERAVAFCPRRSIDPADLPEQVRRCDAAACASGDLIAAKPKGGNGLAEARRNAEKQRLLAALRRQNNNRSRAAVELGISRVTLYKKLRAHGVI